MGKPEKKNPERQRARYTKEFKLEAVRLLESENRGQITVFSNIRSN